MSTPLTTAIRPLLAFQGITGLTGGDAGKLDSLTTASLAAGLSGFVVVSGTVYFYRLESGTDAESSPTVIRPDDYAAVTNEKVWKLLAISVGGGVEGVLLSANNLSDLGDAEAARANLGLGSAATLDAGEAGGVASLDGTGKVPASQLPGAVAGAVSYQGVWNASTNSPDLSGIGPSKGDYYKVSVAGTTSLSSIAEWNVGDFAIYNGTSWDKIDNTEEDATSTVKGRLKLTGDLGGTSDSPTVAGLGGEALPSNAANGFLKRNAANSAWEQVAFGTDAGTVCQGNDSRLANALSTAGGTMTGRLTLAAVSNSQSAITYGSTAAIDFDSGSARTIALTGDWAPTTSNRGAGKMVKIKITADASARNLTWPSWVPIGAALPSSIAAGKTGILTLECWGSNDTDITAAYAVQP